MACDKTSILKKARNELGLNAQQMQALANMIPAMMEVKKSEPMDEVDENYETVLEGNQVYNSEKVKGILNELLEKDTVEVDSAHAKQLHETLRAIVNPVVRAVPEMQIQLNKEAARNNGYFQVTEDGVKVKVGVGVKEQNYGQMSAAEKFVHEMVHAASYFALRYAKQEVSGTVNRLIQLRNEAMKVVTVDDLMPEVVMNEELDRALAEARLEYINKDLEEFLAYALTNKKVQAKLAEVKTYEKKESKGVISSILGMLSDIVNLAIAKFRKEPTSMNGNELVLKLMKDLMQVNNKAEQAYKETTWDKIADKIDVLESKWEEYVDKAKDKVLKEAIKPKPVTGGKVAKLKWIGSNLKEMIFNKDLRGVFEQTLQSVGLEPTGFVQSGLNSMREGDDHEQRITDVMMWSGQVEREREGVVGTIGGMIREGFTKLKLKEEHRQAIFKMVKDDSLALLDTYSNLEEMLRDEKKLDAEVKKLEGELKSKANPVYMNMYTARIEDLVNYMQTGKATLQTATNAEAIAKMVGTPYVDLSVGEDIVGLIDTIVSLKNLQTNTESTKATIAEMLETDKEGMQVTRELQKGAEQQVKERMGAERFNFRKGYIREVYDDAVTVAIAPAKEAAEMKKKGYTEMVPLERSKDLGSLGEPMMMYVSKDMIRQKLNRSTLRFTGDKQEGRTVFEDVIKSGQYSKELVKEMKDRLRTAQKKAVLNGVSGVQQDLDTVLRPIYNIKGEVIDYRYNVLTEHKMEYMGLERDGIEGIARSWGHEIDVKQSHAVNKAAFHEIVYQMAKDFRGSSTGLSQHEYVKLDANSKNPLVREYMKILPKEVKEMLQGLTREDITDDYKLTNEAAEKYVGPGWNELSTREQESIKKELGKGELWVRQDMLYNLMGVRDYSVTNAPIVKNFPREIRTILLRIENFWKQIISLFKVNIIIKVPQVILGNIASNIIYSVQTGQWPWEVFAEYKRGWDALSEFVENEKELRKIGAKLVLDKDNKMLRREYDRLKNNMENSPIQPLIKAGLYSHIIEDLNLDNFKSSNRVVNWMNDKMEGAPEIVKDGLNWLYMSERTSAFQAIQSLTAKSDFVARYAQYTFGMKKAAKKIHKEKGRPATDAEMKDVEKALLREVRDAFVNYNKPDSPFLQYLNDMGIFMFTKYAFRIQRIANQMIGKHPIRFMGALLAQEGLESVIGHNPADIAESVALYKGIGDWLYAPGTVDVLEQIAQPAAYSYAKNLMKML